MRGMKMPLQDFVLKMQWGGGGAYLWDTTVHAVVLNKNHQRNSTVQEVGLTKAGTSICCYMCRRKEAESLHWYIYRLIAHEVGVFRGKYPNHRKYAYSPL